MHLPDGVLSTPILAAGAVTAVAGTAVALRGLDYDRVPAVAVVASAFFVVSLIHIPIGATSIHLSLIGLAGIILGWSIFPAMLVALFIQAIVFQHGGLTTLGVNTFNFAFSGLVCYMLLGRRIRKTRMDGRWIFILGFIAGALGVIITSLLMALELIESGRAFFYTARLTFILHWPVMIIEGLITGAVISSIRKIKPELLHSAVRLRWNHRKTNEE